MAAIRGEITAATGREIFTGEIQESKDYFKKKFLAGEKFVAIAASPSSRVIPAVFAGQ